MNKRRKLGNGWDGPNDRLWVKLPFTEPGPIVRDGRLADLLRTDEPFYVCG